MASVEDAQKCFHRGVGLFRAGDFPAAESNFRRALELGPPRGSVLTNLANALLAQGRTDEAVAYAERSVRLEGTRADAWYVLGRCLNELDRAEGALECYERSLRLDASKAAAWLNLGVTFCLLERHSEALPCFDAALQLQPDDAAAWLNRGLAQFALGRGDAAICDYDRGLALDPSSAELWFNRAAALDDRGSGHEALACYETALRLDPTYAEAWNNRGNTLRRMARPADALASYDRAIACKPGYADPWSNRAAQFYEIGRYDEALASCARALRLKPDFADAHWNESLVHLLLGRFELGWNKYAFRWQRSCAAPVPFAGKRLERLEQVSAGQRILLWAEQGYGDTLQFCRYAPLLADLGAQVVVVVQPALKQLLRSLGVPVLAQDEPPPDFDRQASLLDLPRLFRTTPDSIPARAPYLRTDPQLTARWTGRVPRLHQKLRIGLCCSGNPKHANDRNRSMPLAALASLGGRAQLLLIQKELREQDAVTLRASPHIQYLGDRIDDFSDSAAIVAGVDLVISVDTSLAHLAGALGRPVWILLASAPEWRWMLERTDCPWYPSATLFRQRVAGDWDGVMSQVMSALDRFAPAEESP